MLHFFDKRTSIIGLSQLTKSANINQPQLTQVLAQCDFPDEALEDPSSILTLKQEFTLIRQLISVSENQQLGLIAGQCYRLNTFGPLGLAVTSANSFEDAINLFIQYLDLTYTLFGVQFLLSGPWAYIEFAEDEPLGDLYTYYRDRDLSFAVTAIRDIYPDAYTHTNKRLELKGPRPKSTESYEDFFNCPVLFDQKQNRFLFDKNALTLPLPQANALNLKNLIAQCEEELKHINRVHCFSETITNEITKLANNHIPTQDEVAEQLATTARTIRRKLTIEGSSFQLLLTEVLKQKAIHLLENSDTSIEQIGNQIGYSESAAFIRAFKRWTGKTPLQTRQRKQN